MQEHDKKMLDKQQMLDSLQMNPMLKEMLEDNIKNLTTQQKEMCQKNNTHDCVDIILTRVDF